jgi:hypothetical protein
VTHELTQTEYWVCRTMVFTHGLFVMVGVILFPVSLLFGFIVYSSAREILRSTHPDLQSLLALAGISLFFAECFLWRLSAAVFLLWIAWFYGGAITVKWHHSPGFPLLSMAFSLWPFTGFVLSAVALYARARKGLTNRCS